MTRPNTTLAILCALSGFLAGAVVTSAGFGVWDHWNTSVEAQR